MLDDVYGVGGVPADWTPLGYPPVPLTVLASLGDQVADVQGFRPMVTEAPSVRARASEVSTLTDGVDPASGDPVTVGTSRNDAGALVNPVAYLISGAPSQRDTRRLEWTLELAKP